LQLGGPSCGRAGQDPTSLGHFCWTTYQGKNNLILQIISGYHPCNSDNGHLSVLQQHWRYLDQTQPDNTPHPCNLFWTDLRTVLQQWTDQGDQIIMGIDANKDIHHPDITTFYDKFGMTEILINKHGNDTPPTQNWGSYLIDRLFTTRAILNSQCSYLRGLDAISNHRCLWIDIQEACIFRTTMPVAQAPKVRQLKTEDLRIVKKYLEYLEKHIMTHDLLNKTKLISDLLHDQHDLTEAISTQLDAIDTLWIQGMLHTEHQCHKLHTRPYGWTPLITCLIQTIKYW